jgi:hypothetical protein
MYVCNTLIEVCDTCISNVAARLKLHRTIRDSIITPCNLCRQEIPSPAEDILMMTCIYDNRTAEPQRQLVDKLCHASGSNVAAAAADVTPMSISSLRAISWKVNVRALPIQTETTQAYKLSLITLTSSYALIIHIIYSVINLSTQKIPDNNEQAVSNAKLSTAG